MRRRKFILGVGGTLGSSLVVGSGAFSTVSATRSVTVATAKDDEAYLSLSQQGTGRRSYTDGQADQIAIDIPGPDDDDYGGTDPEGVGPDSVYRFASDAAGDEKGLFAVENSGTTPIKVFGSQDVTAGLPKVKIFDVETGDVLTEQSPLNSLPVGESVYCGLEIDTEGIDPREDEYEISLTINGVAVDT